MDYSIFLLYIKNSCIIFKTQIYTDLRNTFSFSILNSASIGEYVQPKFFLQIPYLLWNLSDHAMIFQIDMIDLAVFEQQINRSKLMIQLTLLQELLQLTVDIE